MDLGINCANKFDMATHSYRKRNGAYGNFIHVCRNIDNSAYGKCRHCIRSKGKSEIDNYNGI